VQTTDLAARRTRQSDPARRLKSGARKLLNSAAGRSDINFDSGFRNLTYEKLVTQKPALKALRFLKRVYAHFEVASRREQRLSPCRFKARPCAFAWPA
jgi:hypothetical protein